MIYGLAESYFISYSVGILHSLENQKKKSWIKLKLENSLMIVISNSMPILIIAEDWELISKDAKSLINKMLTFDPEKRPSAK